ncbi:MAG TPA: hypothetical protein VHL14_11255 [Steroidobacteraceae bacterium]|jgi:hypothetical protein|nr:hypothetical protein [Steroidobacteraceae bacterium]
MNSPRPISDRNVNLDIYETTSGSSMSGVSWAAIFAGAAGAFSLSLVLFILGTGLGLSMISPWSDRGVSASAVGTSAFLWTALTQILASIVGGYLAGRLRVKWVKIHDDEVFFRDTAHGFIAWSVATLGAAVLFIMPMMALVNTGVHVASNTASATVAASVVATGNAANQGSTIPMMTTAGSTSANTSVNSGNSLGYSIDSLFRVDPKTKPGVTSNDNVEVTRIFVADLMRGQLPDEDKTYVAQVVAARTNTSQADAEQRVGKLFNDMLIAEENMKQKAKETADAARKASAHAALWMVIALLAGAFSASFAATFGGRLRDKIA